MINHLLQDLTHEELNSMLVNGQKILECHRVVEKGGSNIVWDILRHSEKFYEWDHYPEGDVYDADGHAQYYYHAHDKINDSRLPEHGHFHLFLRTEGMPAAISPEPIAAAFPSEGDKEDYSHLIAIAMDKHGYPIRLFTTNRWVTGETWYQAEQVCMMLDQFQIDHAWPSWPTNIWLTAMVKFFKPQIKQLIRGRDQIIQKKLEENHAHNIFEDRELEIITYLDISITQQMEMLLQFNNNQCDKNIEKNVIKV